MPTTHDRGDEEPRRAPSTWRRVCLLLALPLLLLHTSTGATMAETRNDIISIPSHMPRKAGADTAVVSCRPYVRVEWQEAEDFTPPYHIRQIAGNDTLFQATTNETDFSVCVCRIASSSLDICSSEGGSVKVRLTYDKPVFPWASMGFTLFFVVISIGGVWLYTLRQKRKLDTTRREIEESKTRHTRKYEFATVLFSDIQGFTKIAAHINPEQLVDELDRYFIYFDELVDRYGVEKIKTIGDAYMCAGGVPDTDSANPIEVTLVGLGMIAYVNERQTEHKNFWNIRVGINTGPVVSGHLGNIKKVFDIWGDTVNTASRMESSGEAGRVNVSESTYLKIQDFFDCEYRGKMPVKYKGEIDMYFVNRLKEEYCQPGSTHLPNTLMLRKMQILRVHDFEQTVRDTTLKGAHPNLIARFDAYLTRVSTLTSMEKMTEDEIAVCGVSAIFIFVKINIPRDTTVCGKVASEELMRKMHLSDPLREGVKRIVAHVVAGKAPEDRMEEVLTDGLNEIYGRKEIIPLLMALHEELVSRDIESKSFNSWLSKQRQVIADFTYYTDSARKLCEMPRAKQLEIVDLTLTM